LRSVIMGICEKVASIEELKARLALFESAYDDLYSDDDRFHELISLCETCGIPCDRGEPPERALMCCVESCTNVLVCKGPGCARDDNEWKQCECGLKCCSDHTSTCSANDCEKYMCPNEVVRTCHGCWNKLCDAHAKTFIYKGNITSLCPTCVATWQP
jgi:hypothetical protein